MSIPKLLLNYERLVGDPNIDDSQEVPIHVLFSTSIIFELINNGTDLFSYGDINNNKNVNNKNSAELMVKSNSEGLTQNQIDLSHLLTSILYINSTEGDVNNIKIINTIKDIIIRFYHYQNCKFEADVVHKAVSEWIKEVSSVNPNIWSGPEEQRAGEAKKRGQSLINHINCIVGLLYFYIQSSSPTI